ncbi:type I glyceraldehyde-3-phosphate dehydrogenase [Patescibacteria group bacterium]|nr:type I glyceraldehyde-3-phosphate dehydrogenase [Patescibacteria group bacterium]
MKKIRVAINGFGRIGRTFFKVAGKREEIEIVAINDLGNLGNIAYLLKYDSVYGKSDLDISTKKGTLVVGGKETIFLNEKDPSKLPWNDLNIDIVLESTGVFSSYAESKVHLDAGAKRVVISAPVKDDPPDGISGATVLIGINEDKLQNCDISSNASCTTNAGSPLIAILNESIGIEKAILNTVHGYTASQSLVDSPNNKNLRNGRAAATNIIPSTTGAAIATTKAIPELEGRFDGMAVRVPVVIGSLVDITFIAKRETNVEEVNTILKKAAEETRWKKVFSTTEEPLVSSDIIGSMYASIADLGFTRVVGGNLVKVLSWYDNEMGYTYALVEHVIKSGSYIS